MSDTFVEGWAAMEAIIHETAMEKGWLLFPG